MHRSHTRSVPLVPISRALWWMGLLLMLWMSGGVAWAHPFLLQASPLPGSVVQRPPSAVRLTFSEDISVSVSRLAVVDQDHRIVSVGGVTLVNGNPREIAVRLSHLRRGAYMVTWTVVSAEDGHVVQGRYPFSVGVPASGQAVSTAAGISHQGLPDGQTLVGLLAHWLTLLAVVTWAGAALVAALAPPAEATGTDSSVAATARHRFELLLRLAVVTLLASSVIELAVEAYGIAGGDRTALPSTTVASTLFTDQYGRLWLLRQGVAVIVLLTMRHLPTRRPVPHALRGLVTEGGSWQATPWLPALLGTLYLYLLAGSGHAASVDVGLVAGSHLLSGAVAVDWLHLLAISLWVGGQISIAAVLIPAYRPSDSTAQLRPFLLTLNRFSPLAYLSVALFTLSGAFNGVIHVPSWTAFAATVYGRALMAKLLLIGMMLLVSGYTVYSLRPRLYRALDRGEPAVLSRLARCLELWLRVNPILGIGVLLATSVLFFYPVPRTLQLSHSQAVPRAPRTVPPTVPSITGIAAQGWEPTGFQGVSIRALAVGGHHQASVFAGTDTGVFRWDGGIMWHRILKAQGVTAILVSPDGRHLIVGAHTGVYLSADGGSHWHKRPVPPAGLFALAAQPGHPRHLIAGGGDGLYVSVDGGLHWHRRLHMRHTFPDSLSWQPGSRRIAFAAITNADLTGGPTGVLISRDAGWSWHWFGSHRITAEGVMAVLATRQAVFAGSMGHGVWRAGAGRRVWRLLPNGMPSFAGMRAFEIHGAALTDVPGHPTALYVGTIGNGVYRSTDGGAHWISTSRGLLAARNANVVLALVYAPQRHALYAGTDDGVYELTRVR